MLVHKPWNISSLLVYGVRPYTRKLRWTRGDPSRLLPPVSSIYGHSLHDGIRWQQPVTKRAVADRLLPDIWALRKPTDTDYLSDDISKISCCCRVRLPALTTQQLVVGACAAAAACQMTVTSANSQAVLYCPEPNLTEASAEI